MDVSALTHIETSITNAIITPLEARDIIYGKSIKSKGIWDTGATSSCITKSAAQKLGLKAISKVNVAGVHGVKETNVYLVELILHNEKIRQICQVTECATLSSKGDVDILIGMNIISKGDFCITNFNGKTTMTFRVPSIEKVDYVEEIEELNRYKKIHDIQSKKNIETCPCKSGKKYKNCHGKNKYGIK